MSNAAGQSKPVRVMRIENSDSGPLPFTKSMKDNERVPIFSFSDGLQCLFC